MELLAVNAQEETDVIPAEDGAEDGIEFVEKEPVGHGEDADKHGTHLAENRSQNQSLEGGGYAPSFRLPAAMPLDPRLPGALFDSGFQNEFRNQREVVESLIERESVKVQLLIQPQR